jgi:enterochelin esterase-like enzyme
MSWESVAVPVPLLDTSLSVRVWTPARFTGTLVVHDGPEYELRTSLAALSRDRRLILLPPGERLEWYSCSVRYAKALATQILPALGAGPVVGIGASLGALAMLHAQRRHPAAFAGLFLQSGSYFRPHLDRQESGFERWLRIVRFTGLVTRSESGPGVPISLTCGTVEENLANNREMAVALRAQGYSVTFTEVPGGAHDWDQWRSALDEHLAVLLHAVF